jgi:hypothetical protein
MFKWQSFYKEKQICYTSEKMFENPKKNTRFSHMNCKNALKLTVGFSNIRFEL